ncbi:MAG: DUF1343 domain-containing protein [Tannerella sp.]|jgi:uncharacterized protein YbbC (DUF1343 family)|nr:DUF1343 domain-containing protein [Tannerella sp.]
MLYPFVAVSVAETAKTADTSETAKTVDTPDTPETANIVVGADRIDVIKGLVKRKRIGLIANQTSVLRDNTHLLDVLLQEGFNVIKIFAPEHGFRGTDDGGAMVKNNVDAETGLPVVSLYGDKFKPSDEHLADIDVIIFDIQDVGVRFFTYISTMHYAMEACAENGKEFILLDRPNPNDYIDGPVRKEGYRSFVGVDPIPVVYGLTVGELARMINGEGWISKGEKSCRLTVVPMLNWRHGEPYSLTVKPSPNLPNDRAIMLYPSLCLFEGTSISVGRGTRFPFQTLGYPDRKYGDFTFVPQSIKGMDANPIYRDKTCHGVDLREVEPERKISLAYLISFYEKSGRNEKAFFNRADWFDLLAGSDELRRQIIKGFSADEIQASWQDDLDDYKKIRRKYLIYPE